MSHNPPPQSCGLALSTSHASSQSWSCNSKLGRCWNPCFQTWPARNQNSQWSMLISTSVIFFSSAPGFEAFPSLCHCLLQWALWVLAMSNELQGASFTCACRMTVSRLRRDYSHCRDQPTHLNAESVQHFSPPCSQVFIFFRSKRRTRTADRQLPTDAELIFPAAWPLVFPYTFFCHWEVMTTWAILYL